MQIAMKTFPLFVKHLLMVRISWFYVQLLRIYVDTARLMKLNGLHSHNTNIKNVS